MKQINKPNNVNDVISLNKENNIVLANKNNSRNILGSFYFTEWSDTKAIKAFIKKY